MAYCTTLLRQIGYIFAPCDIIAMSRHCNVTSFALLHHLHCRDITSYVSSGKLLVTTPTAPCECACQHLCVVDGNHVEHISHTHTHRSTFTYTHREDGCVWVHVTHKAGVQGTAIARIPIFNGFFLYIIVHVMPCSTIEPQPTIGRSVHVYAQHTIPCAVYACVLGHLLPYLYQSIPACVACMCSHAHPGNKGVHVDGTMHYTAWSNRLHFCSL